MKRNVLSYIKSRFANKILFGLMISLISLNVLSQENSKSKENNGLEIKLPDDYNLVLPNADFCELNPYEEVTFNLYLLKSNDSTVLFADGNTINIADIKAQLDIWKEFVFERDRPRMTIRLIIDSSTKMSVVNSVKKELAKNYALRIAYAVMPSGKSIDSKEILKNTIISMLPPPNAFQSYIGIVKNTENSTSIKHTQNGNELFYNGTTIKFDALKDYLKKDLEKNHNQIIKYYFDDNLDFESYISVLSQNHLVIRELREAYSESNYSLQYDELDKETSRKVDRYLSLRLIEVDNELAELAEKQ